MTEYFDPLVAAIEPAVNAFITTVVSEATATLQGRYDALLADKQQLNADYDAALDELTDLHAEVADKTNQIATLTSSNATLTATKASLTAQVAQLQARIAELEAQLLDPVAGPTLFGASATAKSGQTTSDAAEWRRLQQITGKHLKVRRTFEATPTSWSALKAREELGDADTVHVISFKPSLGDTVGSPGWIAWAENLINSFPQKSDAEYRKTYVAIWHEVSGKNLDLVQFKKAFQLFADAVKRVRGDREISVAWIETGWAFAPASGKNPLDYYPGDAAVEVVAPDPYNRSTTKYYALTDATIVGAVQAYEFAKTHGKRFAISEVGSYSNAANQQPKFVTDGANWAKALGRDGDGPVCEYFAWFHSGVGATEDPKGFWLDLQQATLDAWRAAV